MRGEKQAEATSSDINFAFLLKRHYRNAMTLYGK